MTITTALYDTNLLLGLMRDVQQPPSYFLDLFFPSEVSFEGEWIDFEKIYKYRKLAPFVTPMSQGRPIYGQASTITRFKPAYIKMKDAVDPFSLVRRTPGELAMLQPLDPQTRYDAIVAEIVQDHRRAWENRLEVMAAKAALDGKLTVNFDDGQAVLVDFGRAAGNAVVLPHGGTWAAADNPDIIGNVESWRTIVARAPFSGPVDRITFGSDAWSAFKRDSRVQAQLSTISRGTTADFRQSALNGAEVKFMGTWDGLDCYLYAGYYHDASGASQPIMSSKDILLSGRAVQGVRAFASIQDKNAGWQPLPIFSRMYDMDDPGVTYILTQSAPLTVPVNTNNTMKATVLE